MKSWGLVTAAPHEHLVQVRGGQIIRSVQGGSCFRLPGDCVALVDTSVQRLQFVADQITKEKTGVQVTGLAVYRVVEPELAWQVIDTGDVETMGDILREMCVGATRRLVANLTLEDCLTRRKEALAEELIAEVAPVVRGDGRPGDGTDRGWGIAIDTLEIQDVKISSAEVFRRLQAPFREALELEALAAEAEVARERSRLAEEQARAEEVRRRELMALQEARLVAERKRADDQAAHQAALRLREAQSAAEIRRRKAEAARAEQERDAESRRKRAAIDAETLRVEKAAEAETIAALRKAHDDISESRLRELVVTQALPRFADSLATAPETAIYTGEGSPWATGMLQVIAAMGQLGVPLPSK
jgi:regulator of protease activity HflC (stomatin/prohibitin superfamily)